jgi:hypothetical protein
VADSARAQQQEGRAAKGSKCAKNKRISIWQALVQCQRRTWNRA